MTSKQGSYTYEWPRPGLTVDAILITKQSPHQVLLIQRKQDPYAGYWALPGGFVDEYEPLIEAAKRELQEETSIDPSTIEGPWIEIGAFGDPGRDPRGWNVGVAFTVLVSSANDFAVKAADDAADAAWYAIDELPQLAFDHKRMMKSALDRLMLEEGVREVPELMAALQRASSKLQAPWHAA